MIQDIQIDNYYLILVVTEFYEKDLRLPHLVNVGKLHSPHNPTNEKRFVVTMALSDLNGKRLLWDEAVEKISNNIV